MERREQYDPEDIENLLHERGFDELLEEERAYVLRHLSGREEYEKMRALLLHVREDDRTHQPIMADEQVRENVMHAFRAQQQPQWRVWLNTVGGLFQPSDGFAMWRPALALGMLLVLFGIGFYLVRGPLAGPSQQELAEVRRQKAEEPIPAKRPEVTDTITAPLTTFKEEATTDADRERSLTGNGEARITPAAPVERPPMNVEIVEEEAMPSFAEEHIEIEIVEPMADQVIFEKSEEQTLIEAPAYTPHVVTEAELMQNQSMANASGRVQARALQESKSKVVAGTGAGDGADLATSVPVSYDPALLDLLSAGW